MNNLDRGANIPSRKRKFDITTPTKMKINETIKTQQTCIYENGWKNCSDADSSNRLKTIFNGEG